MGNDHSVRQRVVSALREYIDNTAVCNEQAGPFLSALWTQCPQGVV